MHFEFRPVLTVCTLLGLMMLLALGGWQMRRLEWKEALISRTETRVAEAPIPFEQAAARAAAGEDMEYRPVVQPGVYAHDLAAHVFGVHDGEVGVFVFTPLEVGRGAGEGRYVYVNRGFVPQAPREASLEETGAVTGEVEVRGLFRSPETQTGAARFFRAADQPDDNLWFVRDPTRLAAYRGVAAPAYYIDSDGAENAYALPKGGVTRLEFSNRHLEYALTWFGLAATLVGIYLAFSIKRR